MKIAVLGVLLLFVMACSTRVPEIQTEVHIPQLDTSDYVDSYFKEGWKFLGERKPMRAYENFQMSVATDEKLYVGFGYSFLIRNKFKLAQQNFQKALKLNPDNYQAELGVATIIEMRDDRDTAFQYYAKLRSKYPGNGWVKLRYEGIKSSQTNKYLEEAEIQLAKGNSNKYIEALDRATFYSPDILELKTRIADYYVQEALYDKAIEQYELILYENPKMQDIMEKLAEIFEKAEKWNSAILMLKKLMQEQPGNVEIMNKINDLKAKLYDSDLPAPYKNIFFKEVITREDLAALIGKYFEKYLDTSSTIIITDIGGSFAKDHIIKLCVNGIMKTRPDHSFDRFSKITKAHLAVILKSLLDYLDLNGIRLQYTPEDQVIEPYDVAPMHQQFQIIKFLLNTKVMFLDENGNFNPTDGVTPSDALDSLKKILFLIA